MGTEEVADVEFTIQYHKVTPDGLCDPHLFSESKSKANKQVAMLRFELSGQMNLKPHKMRLWVKIPEGETREYPLKKDNWGCITLDRAWTSSRLKDIGITQDITILVETVVGGKWEFDGSEGPPEDNPSHMIPPVDHRTAAAHHGGAVNYVGGHQNHHTSHGGAYDCGGHHRDFYQGHHGGHHGGYHGHAGGHRQSDWIDDDDDMARAIAASLAMDQPSPSPDPPKPAATPAGGQPQKAANQKPQEEEKLDFSQLYLPKEEAEAVWAKLTCESEAEEAFDSDDDMCGPLTHPEED